MGGESQQSSSLEPLRYNINTCFDYEFTYHQQYYTFLNKIYAIYRV